ncbi:cmp-sialic acid transporter 4 [Quercus suber]|uniref:Cmp-sialic acid transporter 4 n=1 Tax=Quercus suber TaxID=58331 RepID=A0AAW0KH91_QUESU
MCPLGGTTIDWSKWKLKIILIVALALLMSSQSIVIVWSKRNGKDIIVETLKCGLSLLALARIWRSEGVTEDNRLSTTLDEVIYYILEHLDAQGYQILKNLNVMALLSGLAGVYTEAIIKKHPSRNINVQNFFLYVYGMLFSTIAIMTQDFDAVMNKGFFYGYSFITVLMILNQALSGLAVSMVMKYADNIVKDHFDSCIGPSYEFAKHSYCVVETLKCGLSLLALARIWRSEGVTEDNRLSTTLDEVIVTHSCYYILEHVDTQGYQILKNLNHISDKAEVMALLSGLAGVYTED